MARLVLAVAALAIALGAPVEEVPPTKHIDIGKLDPALYRYLVGYLSGAMGDTRSLQDPYSALGIKNVRPVVKLDASTRGLAGQPLLDAVSIPGANKKEREKVAEQLRAVEGVSYVHEDYIMQGDQVDTTLSDPKWSLQTNYWAANMANLVAAWNISKGSAEVKVCTVDTGIDYNHPDLQGALWINPAEYPPNGKDDDGNGLIDDVYGARYLKTNISGDPMDDLNHGTHVAGIIGAVGGNGLHGSGINPLGKIKIIACKYLDYKSVGYMSDAIKCINYCRSKGAYIINNSYGANIALSQAMSDAFTAAQNAGMLFAASAGNSAANNDIASLLYYPASLTHSNMIAVAAQSLTGGLATFSSYGATMVDIAAPGSSVLSTYPRDATGSKSGTSQVSRAARVE